MVRVLCVLHQCHHWWVRLYMLCLLGPGCVCVFGACCTRFPGDDDQCVIENDADGGRKEWRRGRKSRFQPSGFICFLTAYIKTHMTHAQSHFTHSFYFFSTY